MAGSFGRMRPKPGVWEGWTQAPGKRTPSKTTHYAGKTPVHPEFRSEFIFVGPSGDKLLKKQAEYFAEREAKAPKIAQFNEMVDRVMHGNLKLTIRKEGNSLVGRVKVSSTDALSALQKDLKERNFNGTTDEKEFSYYRRGFLVKRGFFGKPKEIIFKIEEPNAAAQKNERRTQTTPNQPPAYTVETRSRPADAQPATAPNKKSFFRSLWRFLKKPI